VRSENRAYLLGIVAVVIWSTVASAFKVTLDYLDPLGMLLIASTVSSVLLLLVVIIRGKSSEIGKLGPRSFIRSALTGLINPFSYYVVLFMAYDRLPAQEAQPLNYTWPIVLALLSILILGRRIPLRSIMAILISFTGVVLISIRPIIMEGASLDLLGITLALGSGIIWSVYWIIHIRKRSDPEVSLLMNFAFGSLFILIACLMTGVDLSLGSGGFIGAVYIGIFEMGITFIIWLRALRLTDNTARISNLIYMSPFFSLVFIHIIVGESIYVTTISGLILIVAGIVIQGRPKEEDDSKLNR